MTMTRLICLSWIWGQWHIEMYNETGQKLMCALSDLVWAHTAFCSDLLHHLLKESERGLGEDGGTQQLQHRKKYRKEPLVSKDSGKLWFRSSEWKTVYISVSTESVMEINLVIRKEVWIYPTGLRHGWQRHLTGCWLDPYPHWTHTLPLQLRRKIQRCLKKHKHSQRPGTNTLAVFKNWVMGKFSSDFLIITDRIGVWHPPGTVLINLLYILLISWNMNVHINTYLPFISERINHNMLLNPLHTACSLFAYTWTHLFAVWPSLFIVWRSYYSLFHFNNFLIAGFGL